MDLKPREFYLLLHEEKGIFRHMAEAVLGQGFIEYIINRAPAWYASEVISRYEDLQVKHETRILEAQDLIHSFHAASPFFCCNVTPMDRIGKVNFDFGDNRPTDLATALYLGIAEDQIGYSADGQLVIARTGETVIPPPLLSGNNPQYIIETDEVMTVSQDDPAARVHRLVGQILNPDDLVFGEDTVFLLSLVAGKTTMNSMLHEYFFPEEN